MIVGEFYQYLTECVIDLVSSLILGNLIRLIMIHLEVEVNFINVFLFIKNDQYS
jgi:hypothetical protein